MSATEFIFQIEPEDAGERLDVYLAEQDDPPMTRSQVRKFLDRGEVRVNGQQVKAGYKLRDDDRIVWAHTPPTEPTIEAQAIALTLLYEDDQLAVVDKPVGMVVHPSIGHPDRTLVNALMHHFEELPTIGGELRPGIVHRIDKDTSGALAVTKTDRAHHHLADQFREHSIERVYHALVFGPGLPDQGTFDTLHGRDPNHRMRFTGRVTKGRRAVTHYKVMERFVSGAVLVECRLETGRTHQIRMHFCDAGCPLLGDALYGGKRTGQCRLIDRQALHARTLGFEHPDGHRVFCEAEYPEDFAQALQSLRAGGDWR
ncbi:RluA family pseudouridine synthase [Lujinxingia litoralis]|uniref:RluA family pseudouridine synthase n=1 Tax=Lujinxingia litoralis TaxID=2211119 RepID=UPI0018F2F659|nr:RluA family pseudouridine synthase [Lujinxingia litoralis]